MRIAVFAVLVGTVLAGCGDESASPGQETAVTPSDSPSTRASGPATAVDDLARRLDVDPAGITVVSVEEVTWPDASVGCPKPGMQYAQMLVDGTLIVLETGGQRYRYHAAAGKAPFYCEDPRPPVR